MQRSKLDWLISCAAPSRRAQPNVLPPPATDPELIQLARFHKIESLISTQLHGSTLPDAAQKLHLVAELVRIVKAFKAANLWVLPHKGPLLALAAYGDLDYRDSVDLDVLVLPRQLAQSVRVLGSLGYERADKLRWVPHPSLLRWASEITYYHPNGVAVDLHWRLAPRSYVFDLNPQILASHTTTTRLAGVEIPTLTAEATLVLLAVHGSKHGWEAIGWVADVAWLVARNSELEWGRALAIADEANCRRPLLWALALAKEAFGTDLPDAVSQAIHSDFKVAQLRDASLRRWYEAPASSPNSTELLRFARLSSPGPLQTLRHVFALLSYPTEAEWAGGPASDLKLILRRGRRLIRKYAGGE